MRKNSLTLPQDNVSLESKNSSRQLAPQPKVTESKTTVSEINFITSEQATKKNRIQHSQKITRFLA